MDLNIFGDVAGQYDALERLIERMPSSAVPASLGDMNDRGPKSMEVINFFMKNGMAVHSNHGHLFLDAMNGGEYYGDTYLWIVQGGYETVMSYVNPKEKYCFPEAVDLEKVVKAVKANGYEILAHPDIQRLNLKKLETGFIKFAKEVVHESHLTYLSELPMYIEYDDIIMTHAPINPSIPFASLCSVGENNMDPKSKRSLIWNRGGIRKRENQFQAHGHNKQNKVGWYKAKRCPIPFGVNLDTSGAKILTGMHWPSMEIFQEAY